jgi:hypothetical protein
VRPEDWAESSGDEKTQRLSHPATRVSGTFRVCPSSDFYTCDWRSELILMWCTSSSRLNDSRTLNHFPDPAIPQLEALGK